MKVVVTGATGNVGSSVVKALAADPRVEEVVGLARRPSRSPQSIPGDVRMHSFDVTSGQLGRHFAGADAVIHLAWAIQPARDRELTRRTNQLGTRRVLEAVAEARVPALIHASSIGAYSPGPQNPGSPVDENWPTDGVRSSFYSVDKAAAERMLDDFERSNPGVRTVRLRPARSSSAKPEARSAGSSPARSSRTGSCDRTACRSFPGSGACAPRPSTPRTSPTPTGAPRSTRTRPAPSTSPPTRYSSPTPWLARSTQGS